MNSKRFVIAYQDELDSGKSGFVMFFTEKPHGQEMGRRSSAVLLVNKVVNSDREKEIRTKLKKLGLKTGKWFTQQEAGYSASKVKSKLGFSLFGKLFG
ncbi:hypothetical protein Q4508_02440 [Amphritea sp. 2_MG-2023]|uniref:hypothetical protein n=1 Tax=Amphritea TaxID=515417 RepID=UPI001C06B67E|nr:MULTISPECIES: hypothetical protein [Amphritea]MBU2966728.1 hypothetical protein [Amphritea atlantica]MDO6417413.1 hypothetical protein [Amphritea sp. 2_MG-2023]